MSIQVIPYKLTHRELEARLAPGLSVLPGQLLRLDGSEAVYGRVIEVRVPPESSGREEQSIVVSLLRGVPPLQAVSATLLSPSQMAEEVGRLLPPPEHPLAFKERFSGDFFRLGAFTLVEGDDFVLKYQALDVLIKAVQPYQKVLILDPLGVFEVDDSLASLKAGEDVRLGIQQVSGKRFLDAFGELFPESVRDQALETVAAYWPEAGAFSGFSRLLSTGMIVDSPLKNLILQSCAVVIRNKLFAETPEQLLDLRRLGKNPVSVLDLSGMQDPWKSLFYQEVVAQFFANPDLGIIPVLIYPENYLPDLETCVKKADETELRMLGLASPYFPAAARNLANNTLFAESLRQVILQGDLTLGLPVAFSLSDEVMAAPEPVSQSLNFTPSDSEWAVENEAASILPAPSEAGPPKAIPELFAEEEALPVMPDNPVEAQPIRYFSSWQQDEVADEASLSGSGGNEALVTPAEDALSALDEDAAIETAPPVGFTLPVVDLAAPSREMLPSFLTAEQLSALLSEPPPEAESLPEPEVAQLAGDSLNYPDAEEGAIPEEMGDSSNFPLPVPVEPQAAVDIPVSSPEAPEIVSSPFPADEFEKDEFSFDLNLDAHLDPVSRTPSVQPAREGNERLGQTVSRSLDDFDALNRPPEAPLLDFDVAAISEQAVSPPSLEMSETSKAHFEAFEAEPLLLSGDEEAPEEMVWTLSEESQPAVPAPVAVPVSGGLSDTSLQETLDSLFPKEFTAAEAASPQPVAMADEPVPVIQKKVVAAPAGMPAYKVGDKVRHDNYGMGIVQKVIPMDQSVVLNITFENVGKRLLDPALSELVLESAG